MGDQRSAHNLPPGTSIQTDVSVGAWITPRVLPWGRRFGTRTCAIAPTGFEAYVRVFHHLDEHVGTSRVKIRWAEVAERTGRVMHPAVQFEKFDWPEAPRTGELTPEEASALVEVLRRYTATPEDCFHAIWHGYGFLTGSVSPLVRSGWRPLKRVRLRRFDASVGATGEPERGLDQSLELSRTTTLSLPGREYFLFRGPIDAANQFEFSSWRQTPNMWWPQDHSWFVASEIDMDSTIVACDRACAEALRVSDLEALEIAPTDRLDSGGDTINPEVPS